MFVKRLGELNSSLAIGGALGRIVRAQALPKRLKFGSSTPATQTASGGVVYYWYGCAQCCLGQRLSIG